MNKVFLFALLILCSATNLFSAKSEIILIDAKAYLVEIENDYDVVKVHHRVYNYFSSPNSHEQLLASAIDELNYEKSIGEASPGNVEPVQEVASDIGKNPAENIKTNCPQSVDNQYVMSDITVQRNICFPIAKNSIPGGIVDMSTIVSSVAPIYSLNNMHSFITPSAIEQKTVSFIV